MLDFECQIWIVLAYILDFMGSAFKMCDFHPN